MLPYSNYIEYKYAMEVKNGERKFLIYEFLGKKNLNRTIFYLHKSVKESKNHIFFDKCILKLNFENIR